MLQNFRLAKEQWKQYQGKIQEYLEDIWSPDASEDQDTPSELAGKEFKKRASWYTRCFIPKAKMAFQSATTDAPVEADEELSSEDEDSASELEAEQDQEQQDVESSGEKTYCSKFCRCKQNFPEGILDRLHAQFSSMSASNRRAAVHHCLLASIYFEPPCLLDPGADPCPKRLRVQKNSTLRLLGRECCRSTFMYAMGCKDKTIRSVRSGIFSGLHIFALFCVFKSCSFYDGIPFISSPTTFEKK